MELQTPRYTGISPVQCTMCMYSTGMALSFVNLAFNYSHGDYELQNLSGAGC